MTFNINLLNESGNGRLWYLATREILLMRCHTEDKIGEGVYMKKRTGTDGKENRLRWGKKR